MVYTCSSQYKLLLSQTLAVVLYQINGFLRTSVVGETQRHISSHFILSYRLNYLGKHLIYAAFSLIDFLQQISYVIDFLQRIRTYKKVNCTPNLSFKIICASGFPKNELAKQWIHLNDKTPAVVEALRPSTMFLNMTRFLAVEEISV